MSVRTEENILADGARASADLLAAHRRGDTAEVERLHVVLNLLTKEMFAALRDEPSPDQSYCDVGQHAPVCSGYTEDEADPESCMCRCHDLTQVSP